MSTPFLLRSDAPQGKYMDIIGKLHMLTYFPKIWV